MVTLYSPSNNNEQESKFMEPAVISEAPIVKNVIITPQDNRKLSPAEGSRAIKNESCSKHMG